MASLASITDIPLFPLSAVLFPGGALRLRIFEPRYLDMLRDCARRECGFGVCLILDGHETGAPALPAAVGTLASITDFYTLEQGLLGVSVLGGLRFQVKSTRVRSNGLVHGEVRFWPAESGIELPPEYGLLATILQRLVEQMDSPWSDASKADYEDASWVGFRLAELLPLPASERQQMLELTNPLERLAQLRDMLPRFQR